MRVTFRKSVLSGKIAVPPSKSLLHRALICAALSRGTSRIFGTLEGDDVLATVECLRALGAELSVFPDSVSVSGIEKIRAPQSSLFCRDSASTLRFLLPLCLLSDRETTLCGSSALLSRPADAERTFCRDYGYFYRREADAVTVKGPLSAGTYTVLGTVGSQFISGLLFALPLCEGDSVLKLSAVPESRPYLSLTLAMLAHFGVSIQMPDETTFYIPGGQRYRATDVFPESDFSQAAFFEALPYIGSPVTVESLPPTSLQGDAAYRRLFPLLADGAPTISLANTPDLAPILLVLASLQNGAVFTHTRRLRFKESDRGAAMAEELQKCGADIRIGENSIEVRKSPLHAPKTPLVGHSDHRVVMALSILLTSLGGTLEGAEAVSKSMPRFFDSLRALGAELQIQ